MVWRGGVVLCLDYLCRCQIHVSLYCAWQIPAHLRCTQCSIMLYLMDICFLPCICLWQILQIQTCLCVVVGPVMLCFYEEQGQWVHMAGLPKSVIWPPIAGGGRFQQNLHSSL